MPASFDEEARELTVMAAKEAGLENLTLIEEPAAAFYSWIANHLSQSPRSNCFDGQHVLVCDVGGGTSDFTLIRVNREGDRVDFTRTAVGKHLLLGGDNLDLTLAWLVESKLNTPALGPPAQRPAPSVRAPPRNACSPNPVSKRSRSPCSAAASSLIGGTLRTEITRDEALELALEGFLPFCDLDRTPLRTTSAVSSAKLGLPYVSRPGRHPASRGFPRRKPATSSPTPSSSTAASSSPTSSATASPTCSNSGTANAARSSRTAISI